MTNNNKPRTPKRRKNETDEEYRYRHRKFIAEISKHLNNGLTDLTEEEQNWLNIKMPNNQIQQQQVKQKEVPEADYLQKAIQAAFATMPKEKKKNKETYINKYSGNGRLALHDQ